jgi:hypothetical protein
MTQFSFPNIMSAVIIKPETFAGGSTREQILAFIAGLELKMERHNRFSVSAGNILTNHHKIEPDGRGWVGQIEDFSRKKGFEWISGFKQIGIEVVLNEMNAHQREQYTVFLKKFISQLVVQLSNSGGQFSTEWIDQWLGVVLMHTAWGREMWSPAELDLIEQIDEEVKKINVLNYENPTITDDLDILRYQFSKLTGHTDVVTK